MGQVEYLHPPEDEAGDQKLGGNPFLKKPDPRLAWTQRVLTEKEVLKLSEKDPALTYPACQEILARLNIKDREYIRDDIKKKRRLKAPKDFSAYKTWSPLPKNLGAWVRINKFVLVVKDIPFIGWYEKGKLKGDAQICIGKKWGWTQKGLYKVLEKDPYHISRSYNNAYGTPALMPSALRIYGRVWIHGGDIIGPYGSHGCVNLPLEPAEKLFAWAEMGTIVLITDSLKDLDKDLKFYGSLGKPEVKASGGGLPTREGEKPKAAMQKAR